uniref:Uncharacterized protein n=1 Tax=Octopus bimaculoides TaxID=37653 RepID=A0A0L8H840_OCTBM
MVDRMHFMHARSTTSLSSPVRFLGGKLTNKGDKEMHDKCPGMVEDKFCISGERIVEVYMGQCRFAC